MKCEPCLIYPDKVTKSSNEETIESLKKSLILPLIDRSEVQGAAALVELSNEAVPNLTDQKFECEECDAMFTCESQLTVHLTSNHETRGNKRHRKDTSLLSDPGRPCSQCDELREKLGTLQGEQNIARYELEETKKLLKSKQKELDNKASEIIQLNEKLEAMQRDLRQAKSSTNDEDNVRLQEECDVIKMMAVEKDKTIKKLEDSKAKEIAALKLEKKSSEDALSCATRENTRLKDKENTLVEIFKSMKNFLDINTSDKDNDPSKEKVVSFLCDECDEVFVAMDDLNRHKRNLHNPIEIKCKTCDYKATTKARVKNKLKLSDYVCFELLRCDSEGGGLLTAVHKAFSPVCVSDEEGPEILVVEAVVNKLHVRLINGYGPQEGHTEEHRNAFFHQLDLEIKKAKLSGCLVCIEMDANA